jgi:hypothetical protein
MPIWAATCTKNIGRCSSCDLEYRQIQQRTRLIALFVEIGSWSWLNETNHHPALLRESLNDWSLLPADVSNGATIKRRSERVGSMKQNYSDRYIGRCRSCDLEYRQIQQRTRLIALFVGIGSWSRMNEINHHLALLRESLNDWSLLLADVSNGATIKRRSERVGSMKQNCSDHSS